MQTSVNPPDKKQEQLRQLITSYKRDVEAYNNLVNHLEQLQFELADQQEELPLLTSEIDKARKTDKISQLQANITLFSATLKNDDTASLLKQIKETATKIEQLESEITGKKIDSDSPSFLR